MNNNISRAQINLNQEYIPSNEETESLSKRPRQGSPTLSMPLQPRAIIESPDSILAPGQSVTLIQGNKNSDSTIVEIHSKEQLLAQLYTRGYRASRVVDNILSYLDVAHMHPRYKKNSVEKSSIEFNNKNYPGMLYFLENGQFNPNRFPHKAYESLNNSEKEFLNKAHHNFLNKIDIIKSTRLTDEELIQASELLETHSLKAISITLKRNSTNLNNYFINKKPTQLTLDRVGTQLAEKQREKEDAKSIASSSQPQA